MSMSRAWLLTMTLTMTLTMRVPRAVAAEHVCTKMENYTVTSMETYVEPVVVNTFTWCLRIPPRCPETRTEMRQRYRTKWQVKSRTVKECCEGYVSPPSLSNGENAKKGGEEEEEMSCVPFCANCLRGVCVSPNKCRCHSGYTGEDCSKECSPGLWGVQCLQVCDCGMNVTCEATNGTCRCPSGRRGPRCADTCPSGFWGPGCSNRCQCEDIFKSCHPDNGNCVFSTANSTANSSATTNTSSIASTITTAASEITQSERDDTHFPTTVQQSASEFDNHVVSSVIERSFEITEEEAAASAAVSSSTMENLKMKAPKSDNDPSTTLRPVIVLVSVPDRRHVAAKDRAKFALQDTLLGRFEEKPDFVKKVQKEKDAATATTVPLEVALIIVASVVFLGLTSIAVFAILHMRSKLLEGVRLSIYDDEEAHNRRHIGKQNFQQERPKISANLIDNAFPQTPPQAYNDAPYLPRSASHASETTARAEAVDRYANGTIATVGLRISRDLRDFLRDDHYDRPPTTLVRLGGNFEEERCAEHLYDEIPLQSTPLCSRKGTS